MSLEQFPRGVEVVVAPFIINDNNEILLMRSPKWDTWISCGGHVEPGETLENAVKRETLEEIGVKIEVTKQIGFEEVIVFPPEFKRNAHLIGFYFLAKLKTNDFKLNEEISEIKWFKIDDAINDENVRKTIRKKLKELL